MLLIGIYPHLQAIGLECPSCGYILLQKKEIQDPNCPNLDTKNFQLPPLSNTWSLGKHFNQVYCAEGCFFLHEKNRSSLGRYSESRHPQIHLLLMPLAVLRKVLQGLEAYIKGEQTSNNTRNLLILNTSLAAWGANRELTAN